MQNPGACQWKFLLIIIIVYFDSGGMADTNNRQITIDNTRKYRKTDRHIVDKWKRTETI